MGRVQHLSSGKGLQNWNCSWQRCWQQRSHRPSVAAKHTEVSETCETGGSIGPKPPWHTYFSIFPFFKKWFTMACDICCSEKKIGPQTHGASALLGACWILAIFPCKRLKSFIHTHTHAHTPQPPTKKKKIKERLNNRTDFASIFRLPTHHQCPKQKPVRKQLEVLKATHSNHLSSA